MKHTLSFKDPLHPLSTHDRWYRPSPFIQNWMVGRLCNKAMKYQLKPLSISLAPLVIIIIATETWLMLIQLIPD